MKTQEKPITINCELCGGTGELEEKVCFHSGHCPCAQHVVTCPDCEGSGEISLSFQSSYSSAQQYFDELLTDANAGREEAYERRREIKRDLEAEAAYSEHR